MYAKLPFHNLHHCWYKTVWGRLTYTEMRNAPQHTYLVQWIIITINIYNQFKLNILIFSHALLNIHKSTYFALFTCTTHCIYTNKWLTIQEIQKNSHNSGYQKLNKGNHLFFADYFYLWYGKALRNLKLIRYMQLTS